MSKNWLDKKARDDKEYMNDMNDLMKMKVAANQIYSSTTADPVITKAMMDKMLISTIMPTTGTFASTQTTYRPFRPIVSLASPGGAEIVRMDQDGTITWADDANISEAAKAFEKVIYLSAETKAGFGLTVKQKMRDSIFADLIQIAQDKGSLTADDLTFLLQSSKIMEKLRGEEE